MRKKKVLILCPSPRGTAATQRLKYEQYLTKLEEAGYSFTISSFQSDRFWKIIYKPGRTAEKIFWTIAGYGRRVIDLLRAPFYDAVFVNLWVTPLGLPFFERVLFLFNTRVIYDIDDMLYVGKTKTQKVSWIQKLKGRKKPLILIRKARFVIVCTPSLEEFALRENKYKQVVDISSTFDTHRFVPVKEYNEHSPVIIGWTGTHSTLPFLESLQPVLKKLALKRHFRLLVIANKEYEMADVPTDFLPWNADTEVADLHKMDIGLYPIPADEWSLGKSSLKALTYMSIAIPFVATAYGTNFRIMENGVQGFMAASPDEWEQYLIKLIDDVELRKRMGREGRRRVVERFSVEANYPAYENVFSKVTNRSGN